MFFTQIGLEQKRQMSTGETKLGACCRVWKENMRNDVPSVYEEVWRLRYK